MTIDTERDLIPASTRIGTKRTGQKND